MSAVTKLRSVASSFVVSQIARRLEKTGAAKRAATHAIIQVEASQTGLLAAQIEFLSAQFDRVLAVWPDEQAPGRLPRNVEVFTPSSGITSRWQLLGQSTDCFVFPVSLIKPIQQNHVAHLKRHLFATGGANSVGLFNFGPFKAETEGQLESALDLVPMPILDPDYSIIDQRFWKLTGSEFEGLAESSALAQEGHARTFGLYACNDSLAVSHIPRNAPSRFSRFDLVEAALRLPKLIQKLTPDNLQTWTKAWDSLGAKGELGSSTELSGSVAAILARNDAFARSSKTATRKILGSKAKKLGVLS
jgi:hypothetical protein